MRQSQWLQITASEVYELPGPGPVGFLSVFLLSRLFWGQMKIRFTPKIGSLFTKVNYCTFGLTLKRVIESVPPSDSMLFVRGFPPIAFRMLFGPPSASILVSSIVLDVPRLPRMVNLPTDDPCQVLWMIALYRVLKPLPVDMDLVVKLT